MDKTIQFRDTKGFYSDEGTGSSVVLVHGFGEDGSVWDGLKKKLSSDFRFIIPDLPGYRNSTLPREELTIEWMADFVYSIIEQEEIKNPIVIGHSMGGYVTLALAEKHPALPEKIGLFHSHAFADDEEKKKNRQKSIDFIQRNGTSDYVNELYNNLFSEKFRTENEATVDKIKAYVKMYSSETLIAGLKAMIMRPDRTSVLKSFKGPVLFVIGKHDKAIPYGKSLEQCQFPDVSQVHILQDSGHEGMMEEPEKSLNIMREFINLRVAFQTV